MKASDLLEPPKMASPLNNWDWMFMEWDNWYDPPLSAVTDWLRDMAPQHYMVTSNQVLYISPEALKFLRSPEGIAMVKLHHESK